MTTSYNRDITTSDTAAELTDGYHLVVEALKLNDVRTDLRRSRHPDHRRGPHCAGIGYALHRLPSRKRCRTRAPRRPGS